MQNLLYIFPCRMCKIYLFPGILCEIYIFSWHFVQNLYILLACCAKSTYSIAGCAKSIYSFGLMCEIYIFPSMLCKIYLFIFTCGCYSSYFEYQLVCTFSETWLADNFVCLPLTNIAEVPFRLSNLAVSCTSGKLAEVCPTMPIRCRCP